MKTNHFRGKKVVIGVTGGIACYKAVDIAKKMKGLGADVHVIMTEHAKKLVDRKDFKNATGNKVHDSLFHPDINYIDYIKKNKPIKHISLADIADMFLVCPATANVIGKIANGICDDLLTTSIMATNAPVLICPAMNVKMWKNTIMQENVANLRKSNYHFADPEYGELACGYKGMGRLAGGEKIIESASLLLKNSSDFSGKNVLVTAGATYEEIDPVRVITNKSSGKMGCAIAEQAFLRGANVVLLRGTGSAEPKYHFHEEVFTDVDDLFSRIKKHVRGAGIVIHSAAVSDFTVEKNDEKIKSTSELHLELTPSTKILEKLKSLNSKMVLVGFKAEVNLSEKELADKAYGLLKSADADIIVANDVGKKGAGFDVDTNEVLIIGKKTRRKADMASKRKIADEILDEARKLL
jgi:phosphopantothenoylcysteine decarboxylase / phosphopantothenate---cysteine ligase